MRRIKLTLAYDGTRFSGWQTQKTDRTVQAVIEDALAKIHGHPVGVTGAGRTDAGVHAAGQVAHFDSDNDAIPEAKFIDALNGNLPHDVRILESNIAALDFHARFSATKRTYRYYFDTRFPGMPHQRLYAWQLKRRLDVTRLNGFARCITGKHDFTSFASALDPSPSKEKTVDSSCFYESRGLVVYEISAKSFLWKMVRNIVGTILGCVNSGRTPDDFLKIMEAADRRAAGPCAPARGLFLERVAYGE
jgi:tRNA pseudouridine38-40 synthase